MATDSLTIDQLDQLDRSELISRILSLQNQVADMASQFNILSEQIALMNQRTFGRRSEKSQADGQLSLFNDLNEAEASAKHSPEPSITEVTVSSYKRSGKKPGKKEEDLEGLPARIIDDVLPEEELDELFPNGYKELPYKVQKRLAVIPQTFIVEEHHIHVYASKDNNGKMAKGRPAPFLFKGSIATPSLVSLILSSKYENAVPLARQAAIFRKYGINLASNTLANWCILSSDYYFSLLYDLFHKILCSYRIVNADETPFQVNKDGRDTGTKSYMWVYRAVSEDGDNPIVLYNYQKTRKTDHPREFLKGFSGIAVTDGYQAYHKLENERPDLTIAGCWVHAKRRFSELLKAKEGKTFDRSIAKEAEDRISELMHLDNLLDGLPPDEKLKLRRKTVAPKVDEFFEWARKVYPTVPEKGATGKGLSYCLNQEKYLRVFLTDAAVPMDNNAAERAIRPFTIGRKNWVMVDTVNGAGASATIYSMVETAKANHLKVYDYFEFLLEELSKHQKDTNRDFLNDLLPWSPIVQEKFKTQDKSSKDTSD